MDFKLKVVLKCIILRPSAERVAQLQKPSVITKGEGEKAEDPNAGSRGASPAEVKPDVLMEDTAAGVRREGWTQHLTVLSEVIAIVQATIGGIIDYLHFIYCHE